MICFDVSVRHPLPQAILNKERKGRKITRKDQIVQKVHHLTKNILNIRERRKNKEVRAVRHLIVTKNLRNLKRRKNIGEAQAVHHPIVMKNIQSLNIQEKRKNLRY